MLTKAAAIARRKWFYVDATGLVLGRLAVKAADLLRGKNKPDFTPNQDCGDFLIIANANHVALTGNKLQGEKWYRHSGYIGGIKARTGQEMVDHHADQLVRDSIARMLPKNRLSRQIIRKLKIYKEASADHSAQNPTTLDWSDAAVKNEA